MGCGPVPITRVDCSKQRGRVRSGPNPQADRRTIRLPLGIYAAGTFTSDYMRPHVTFTVPDGLQLRAEAVDYLWLSIGSGRTAPEIPVMRVARAGVIARLVGRSDLTVSAPVDVTVAGLPARAVGLRGINRDCCRTDRQHGPHDLLCVSARNRSSADRDPSSGEPGRNPLRRSGRRLRELKDDCRADRRLAAVSDVGGDTGHA